MSTRVLVADDQPLVRVGLTKILEARARLRGRRRGGRRCAGSRGGSRLRPDVVLMDIRMPGMDGLEATRRIVDANGAATRVLVLTTFGRNEYVYEALRAGASGFLLKDTPTRRAARRRRNHRPRRRPARTRDHPSGHRGVRAPSPTPAAAAGEARTPDRPRNEKSSHLLARGLANAEIAKELYISEATVRTHVLHVLQKLDLRDRIHAVIYAYETGLAPSLAARAHESGPAKARSPARSIEHKMSRAVGSQSCSGALGRVRDPWLCARAAAEQDDAGDERPEQEEQQRRHEARVDEAGVDGERDRGHAPRRCRASAGGRARAARSPRRPRSRWRAGRG